MKEIGQVWRGMSMDERKHIIEAQRQLDGGHQRLNVSLCILCIFVIFFPE